MSGAVETGDHLEVKYVEVTTDLADGSATYSKPKTLTMVVEKVTNGYVVGVEFGTGRAVNFPLESPTGGSLRARPAGLTEGAFSEFVGDTRGVEVLA